MSQSNGRDNAHPNRTSRQALLYWSYLNDGVLAPSILPNREWARYPILEGTLDEQSHGEVRSARLGREQFGLLATNHQRWH